METQGTQMGATDNTKTPPYGAYAGIMATFTGGLAFAGLLARLLGRDPRGDSALDLAVLSAATFKAARTIARDDVTSFLRNPFVEGDAGTGENEEPKETGDLQQGFAGAREQADEVSFFGAGSIDEFIPEHSRGPAFGGCGGRIVNLLSRFDTVFPFDI